MKKRAFWGALAALIVLNGAILAFVAVRRANHHPEPLRLGARLPALSGVALPSGNEIEIRPGQWNLILYLSEDSDANQRRLVAAQALLDEFSHGGLRIAAVAPTAFPSTVELVEMGEIRFPVLEDRDGSFLRELSLAHPSDAMFLLDGDRRLQFQSVFGTYAVADMGYLVEKHVTGRIVYPEEEAGMRITVGSTLPPLDLHDLRTGEAVTAPTTSYSNGTRLVFFTSECSTCSLGPYMATFRALEARLISGSSEIIPVFSPLFSPIEVVAHASELEIQAPLLTTSAEAIEFAASEADEEVVESELTVVEIDGEGVVRSIRPLSAALKEVEL